MNILELIGSKKLAQAATIAAKMEIELSIVKLMQQEINTLLMEVKAIKLVTKGKLMMMFLIISPSSFPSLPYS